MGFSPDSRSVQHGDEYYSPQNVVDMIVPYVLRGGYKTIWCPFDTKDSLYVKTFQKLGYEVNYGHIDTGQDFFDYTEPQGDIVVSNPPFSKRDDVLKHLYELDIPFAIVIGFNGLFDNRKRFELFKANGIQMLVPRGRMRFVHKEHGLMKSPVFQSIYICSRVLDSQIVFSDSVF